MSLSLAQTYTAVAPNITSSFQGIGGTSPYTYQVLPNGAGGSINSTTGVYTAPSSVGSTPQTLFDTIQVTDNVGATANAKILVGTYLDLFCDILQNYLELPSGRAYLWDQKIMQPTDSGLYVAVSVPVCKPFANTMSLDGSGGGLAGSQSVNMMATLDIDIISRDSSARDQKELVVLALLSQYSEQQQEANSFFIGRLPPNSRFTNLSLVDGAAIPYRYKISVNMQYSFARGAALSYYSSFSQPTIYTNP